MFGSKLFSSYQFICIALVLLVNSGCFVTKAKYDLKAMELAKTKEEYTALKEKTGEIKQKLAGLVKEKESLEAKYLSGEEEKKELSAQIDTLKSQIKETEARLNEQKSKIATLKKERDNYADIVQKIKNLVANVQGLEEIKESPQQPPAKDKQEEEPIETPTASMKEGGEEVQIKQESAPVPGISPEKELIIQEPPDQGPTQEDTK